jgi:hypothetical protein
MIYFHFFLSFFYNYFSMQEEHVHVQRLSANHEKSNTLAYTPV